MNHADRTAAVSTRVARSVIRAPASRRLRLACVGIALALPALAVPVLFPQFAAPANARQAATDAPKGAAPVPADLLSQVEDYYHYATIGQYDAANALGQQLLQGSYSSEQYLDAFRQVHDRRSGPSEDLDRRFTQWQGTPQLTDVANQIVAKVNDGRRARATNRDFIAEQIERLSRGQQAYNNAVDQLRNSGEYAVPVMIDYLLDPSKKEFQADVRRAMRDSRFGVELLSPLLAATQMQDENVLSTVLRTLGDLRYNVSVPYLLEQVQTSNSQQVKAAARQALEQIGYTGGSDAATEFYNLAEKFYYNRTPIQPKQGLGIATVWSWGGRDAGLVRTDVPPQIFNEVMAMRSAGKSLSLGQGQDQSLALWLASNYRREGDLKEGQEDKTRPANNPDAKYYGTQAGTRYLQMVLDRAERDRRNTLPEQRYNAADVALRSIKSLQEIVGRGNVGSGESPLTRAMNFPDRRVRIEAAFALAQSLPTQGFSGQEQVVPLLADALSQTGQPSVLVVSDKPDKLNTLAEQMRGGGFKVNTAPSLTDAVTQAGSMASVDEIVVDASMSDRNIDDFLAISEQNPKLSGAAKLMLVGSEASRYEAMKDNNPTLATTTATEGDALLTAAKNARGTVGGLPLDPDGAQELALRSGNLLKLVGTSNSIFNLQSGQNTVLAALDDDRPAVQMLAGQVAALLDTTEGQPALLDKAAKADTDPAVRVSLFESLATGGKIFGNRLGGDGVNKLLAAAADAGNLDVQAAAAQAVGAMNLPADQARRLIVESTKQTEAPNN